MATLAPAPPGVLEVLQRALPRPGAVRGRAIDRLAAAHDASHFLLTPAAVTIPADAAEVGTLFRAAAARNVSLTFRSEGTNLSGQSVTDSVLVDTRRHFRGIEVLDGGLRVRTAPDVTVRALNTRLALFGRKVGPGPASENSCTAGGAVGNNSSRMACGTAENVYSTIESMVLAPHGKATKGLAGVVGDQSRGIVPCYLRHLLLHRWSPAVARIRPRRPAADRPGLDRCRRGEVRRHIGATRPGDLAHQVHARPAPTCFSRLLAIDRHLHALAAAAAVADDVTEPADWGCCAFAGQRDLLHPELTAAATQPEATTNRRPLRHLRLLQPHLRNWHE